VEKKIEELPKVNNLRAATLEVIKNNRQLGYPPISFYPNGECK
jgi:hypothetical protein